MDKKDLAPTAPAWKRLSDTLALDGELIAANATIRQLNQHIEALQAELSATKGEIEALKAAHTWQPIETAPKKVEVLLSIPTFNRYWVDMVLDGDCYRNDVVWMPLPPTDSKPVEGE